MQVLWISSPEARRSSSIIAIILGLLIVLLSPFIPELFVIIIAALVLILSLILISFGISLRGSGIAFMMIGLGICGCIFCAFTLMSPDIGVSLLGIILGIWTLLFGATQIAYAPMKSYDKTSYFMILALGIISLMFGIYLIISPRDAIQMVTFFAGFYLIIYGLLNFIKNRKSLNEPTT